jgi:hypothetical protein
MGIMTFTCQCHSPTALNAPIGRPLILSKEERRALESYGRFSTWKDLLPKDRWQLGSALMCMLALGSLTCPVVTGWWLPLYYVVVKDPETGRSVGRVPVGAWSYGGEER